MAADLWLQDGDTVREHVGAVVTAQKVLGLEPQNPKLRKTLVVWH